MSRRSLYGEGPGIQFQGVSLMHPADLLKWRVAMSRARQRYNRPGHPIEDDEPSERVRSRLEDLECLRWEDLEFVTRQMLDCVPGLGLAAKAEIQTFVEKHGVTIGGRAGSCGQPPSSSRPAARPSGRRDPHFNELDRLIAEEQDQI